MKQQNEGKLAKLSEVVEKILGICDVNRICIGGEVAASAEIIAKITSCIVRLNSVASKHEVQTINNNTTSSSIGTNSASHQGPAHVREKLPKI